jgi:hypothetical protein
MEICWQKLKNPDGSIWFMLCNATNTYCAGLWKMCYDPTIPFPHIRRTLMYPYHISGDYEGRCQGVEPPADPTEIGVPTVCFELHTECNPE